MIARIAAVLAAVAMVAGAITLRSRLDDRAVTASTTLRLVCSPEMAGTCEALAAGDARVQVTVEEPAVTAGRLSGPEAGDGPPLGGWLVAGPWPTFVADARERAGLPPLVRTGRVLARSPIVLVVWPARRDRLAANCPPDNQVGWRCLGEKAGLPWTDVGGEPTWGRVTPGHALPTTAVGLAVVGAATVGFFGRTDLSRADLDQDDYRGWLRRLERAVRPAAGSPLETMLLQGPAAYDAVGTVEAEARLLLDRSARTDKPVAIYPSPMATADVVLGTFPGREGELLGELLAGPEGRKALGDQGWRLPGEAGRPPIPANSPQLAPGVLDALRQVVEEAGR